MPIVTDTFKKLTSDQILTDMDSAVAKYYIGLGRSQEWPDLDIAPTVINTLQEERDFRYSLQGIKQVSDFSKVVPRVNWSAGTIYSSWTDSQVGYPTVPFYVMNATNQVFVCIKRGVNTSGTPVPSVVQPTGASTTLLKTADGYIWKYLYELSAAQATRFLAGNWMPTIYDSDVSAAAIPGQIASIAITSGGTGYTSAPSVTIDGDGSVVATATAFISGGSIVRIDLDSSGTGQLKGSGYKRASVSFSAGNATARPMLAPDLGFGKDTAVDLKSTAILINSRPAGDEPGLLVNQDFRQVALLKNFTKNNTDSDVFGSAGALNKLLFNAGASLFTQDNLIVGGTSAAKAYIDFVDSAAGVLYHQTNTTGFKRFTIGETLTQTTTTGVGLSGTAVLASIDSADVNPYSGEVLYIDNRSQIDRSPGETQDIKIVIQL